jgi:DNA (cytosine-5)-methyltransferase 1
MLTGVSLFAGVGGFDLAMQRQGVKVAASVEIDKKCNEVLAHHFPDATQFTDVTTVKGEDLINAGFNPSTGIITGGFPCQDLSVAGKRAGLAGERSGLFWEIARIVEETQTEYFIIENVPGLLSSNNGKDFGVIIGTMADIGYSIGWRVLDAQYFGVPQRRRRVFIVGRRSSDRGVAEILFKSEGLRRDLTQNQQARENTTNTNAASVTNSGTTTALRVAYSMHGAMIGRNDSAGPSGSGFLGVNKPAYTLTASSQARHGAVIIESDKSSVRHLTPIEYERLQGFPDNWTAGQPDSIRYKQMGNAVAVPVVEWIVQNIVDVAKVS